MPDTYQDVLFESNGGVALVTLNRPEKLNAWTDAMERSIQRAIGAAAADDAVRVIVVTGAGRGFCAGADMNLLQELTEEAPDPGRPSHAGGSGSAPGPG